MSVLREVPVYWVCKGCGREGSYTTWDMNADPEMIDSVVIHKKQIGECPYCTDCEPGNKEDTKTQNILDQMIAWLQEIDKRLDLLEKLFPHLDMEKIQVKRYIDGTTEER